MAGLSVSFCAVPNATAFTRWRAPSAVQGVERLAFRVDAEGLCSTVTWTSSFGRRRPDVTRLKACSFKAAITVTSL